MNKNVIVTDKAGNQIGLTYPKRARGLVKHGRAVYTDECVIRLTDDCPSDFTEDKAMHALYIEPRSFHPVETCENNVFSRSYIGSFLDGKLQEALMLGDWGWNWSEIASEPLELQPDTDYVLTFWLNGGENDCYNETCDLRILFTDDAAQEFDRENELIYKLNRRYIRPLKKVDGWELYEIPFRTENKQYTFLKFVAMRAPMAILPAGDAADYAALEDRPHPLEEGAKQRPNIVFENGYPEETEGTAAEMQAAPSTADARAVLLQTLQKKIAGVEPGPYTEAMLKELKDMLNMLLREE